MHAWNVVKHTYKYINTIISIYECVRVEDTGPCSIHTVNICTYAWLRIWNSRMDVNAPAATTNININNSLLFCSGLGLESSWNCAASQPVELQSCYKYIQQHIHAHTYYLGTMRMEKIIFLCRLTFNSSAFGWNMSELGRQSAPLWVWKRLATRIYILIVCIHACVCCNSLARYIFCIMVDFCLLVVSGGSWKCGCPLSAVLVLKLRIYIDF